AGLRFLFRSLARGRIRCDRFIRTRRSSSALGIVSTAICFRRRGAAYFAARAVRGNGWSAAGNAYDYIEFVTALLDMSSRARLKSERKNGAVAGALGFHVGEASATDGFGARNISGRNLYIESIAAPIRFIVVERLIRTDRYARSFRRFARAESGHMRALRRRLRCRPHDFALRGDGDR